MEQGIGEYGETGQRSAGAGARRGEGAAAADTELPALAVKSRVRLPTGGTGEVLDLRDDGTAVVAAGAMKIVLEASALTPLPGGGRAASKERERTVPKASTPSDTAAASLEIDLRGLSGDEAEQATIAAVDAAVLAEQPFLRIIHGMGTGVVRERVRRVVSGDRRVSRFGFAPRNQGGTGVTIVEFSA